MDNEAIEIKSKQPFNASEAREPRSPHVIETRAHTTQSSDAIEVARLSERLERLEGKHDRLKRDAFLVAAVTTIVSLFTASSLIHTSLGTAKEPEVVPARRFIEAQAFLLKDAQGHVRARLTLE